MVTGAFGSRPSLVRVGVRLTSRIGTFTPGWAPSTKIFRLEDSGRTTSAARPLVRERKSSGRALIG